MLKMLKCQQGLKVLLPRGLQVQIYICRLHTSLLVKILVNLKNYYLITYHRHLTHREQMVLYLPQHN